MWRTPAVQASPHRFPPSSLKRSCSLALLDGASAGWCMALKRDVAGVRHTSFYTIRGYNCTICRRLHRFNQKCLQASMLSLLPAKDRADKGAGVTAPPLHRCTPGHFEPPPHLPVFSEPVWTLLIVITGKFHQTVISGPLYKYSGIS